MLKYRFTAYYTKYTDSKHDLTIVAILYLPSTIKACEAKILNIFFISEEKILNLRFKLSLLCQNIFLFEQKIGQEAINLHQELFGTLFLSK